MLAALYWLTGRAIDGIRKDLAEFNAIYTEFIDAFEEEESTIAVEHGVSLTQIMRETWESGGVWFWHSIMSTNAMYPLFTYYICPRFSANRLLFREERLLSNFWSEDAGKVVESKVEQYQAYKESLTPLFNQRIQQ